MEFRKVTNVRKDDRGEVTHLCGDWGVEPKQIAIGQIERRTHTYYVENAAGRVNVRVVRYPFVQWTQGSYLQTEADGEEGNNLGKLPPC